jgi:hypothetical protein
LSRLTPNRGKIDRDALIFAAGRRSAGKNRGWKAMTGILVAGQLLTLAFLGPHPAASRPSNQVRIASDRPEQVERGTTAPLPSEWLQLRESLLAGERMPAPKESNEALVPDDPPLRAFAVASPTLLN